MTSTLARTVALRPLIAPLAGAQIEGTLDLSVSSLTYDSRRVEPGALFVALRGERVDGHAFIERALERGAVALVIDAGRNLKTGSFVSAGSTRPTVIEVADTQRALSQIANVYFGVPSQALAIAGITGTNGKTTTSHFVQAILEAAGRPCGRIGTLGAQFAGAMWPLENTTPLAPELQATLAAMLERGARAVAMEVSSHALSLDRVTDVTFAVAALTNVTRDHLDFHGTLEAYEAAKRSLFELAPVAVLNLDDGRGARWSAELRAAGKRTIGYGFAAGEVRAQNLVLGPRGSSFTLDGTCVEVQLPGRFNVANALCALAIARALGVDDAAGARGLAAVDRVAGRMERLGGGGIEVLVDYAHTPDALAHVLGAAREMSGGRLIAVFGCGGDRDRGKRAEMGRIAGDLADHIVLTSDNPRGEDPQAIVDQIVAGLPLTADAVVELDRAAAIRRAIANARPGDVVIVAGKGHETYQITGDVRRHFDDRDVVRAALAERGGAA